jgi:outer membrane protein assembly factor BamB
MAIRPGGKGDVSRSHVLWRRTRARRTSHRSCTTTAALHGGRRGRAERHRREDGQRVWQERTGGVFTASPVAADGKIYLLSEDGQTIVLAAGQQPRVLARNA